MMPPVRSDAAAKILGAARYGTDLEAPGMLWGALVPAPLAHGRILRVDVSEALRLPGVVAIVGSADLPSLLPGGGGDPERPVFPTGEIAYQNQPVAAVAARSLAEARTAARAVVVDVEPLRVIGDLDELFTEWPGESARNSPHVIAHVKAGHGNVERAFAQADLVHSETFRTSGIHQVAMEPHACLAEVSDGRWHVTTSTQSPFGVREDAASILGISETDLVVEGTWVGGGFGGKGAAFLEPFALVLARATHRPVKLALSYREEFQLGRSTLPSVVRLDTSVKRGRMTARRVRLLLDSGASLPGRDFATGYAIGFLLGPYRIPSFEMEGFAIRTNKPPFGPHRAPFAPQCVFMVDSHMDSLARRIGVDPIAFRLQHAWVEGDKTHLGQSVGAFGLVQCLERAQATVARWRKEATDGHGIGVGCGYWSTGTGAGGEARLHLTPTELIIDQGEREIGSGSVIRGLVAVAERVLGLQADAIRVDYSDTSRAPFDSGVFGSRTVGALGQAVEKAARKIATLLAKRLKSSTPIHLERSGGSILAVAGSRRLAVSELFTAAEARAGEIVAEARHYGKSGTIDERRVVDGSFYPYTDFTAAAHVAEVVVDRETGAVRVVRYAAFQDAGVVLDPVMVQTQVEGAVAMGLGEALTEESLWTKDGVLTNPTLLDYRIPTLGEVPPIEVETVEGFLGAGPFGTKGIGEPPIIPVPATVANAVADATGARVYELPLSAERVARALKVV